MSRLWMGFEGDCTLLNWRFFHVSREKLQAALVYCKPRDMRFSTYSTS